MAIPRTAWIDDDGSGTTGTVINNAEKTILYNQIDAVLAPAWAAYTPTWTTFGAAPALGNGTLVGSSAAVGGITYFELHFTMGSTTTYGSGGWALSLPAPIVNAAAFRALLTITGRGYDSSAGTSAALAGAVPVSPTTFEFYAAGGSVSNLVPFTWASGDILQIAGFYRSI